MKTFESQCWTENKKVKSKEEIRFHRDLSVRSTDSGYCTDKFKFKSVQFKSVQCKAFSCVVHHASEIEAILLLSLAIFSSQYPQLTRRTHPLLSRPRKPLSISMASSFSPEKSRVPPALPVPLAPLTKFKIGLCQLSVTADKERNIAHAREAIHEAAAKGAQLVLLPEIWNSPYSNDSFAVYAEDIDGGVEKSPSTAMLSQVSRLLKITIVGGSIPERSGDRIYNTCCVFGSAGELKAKHRKVHLFDIDIPGKMTFMESKTLTAGETPTVVDTDVGRIGVGICHDIVFPELAMIYAARGAHLLCYPGAFEMTTGPLHWELFQRARATDNQLYVATCSPARDAKGCYVAWGHSTLVGPFGEVLATTGHDEDIVIAEVDYSLMELRRTSLPLSKQRRGDLYQLVDEQRLNSMLLEQALSSCKSLSIV